MGALRLAAKLFVLFACVIGCTGSSSGGVAVDCVNSGNRSIMVKLRVGELLDDVVHTLEAVGARYSLFSKDEQELTLEQVRALGYSSIQPLRVIVIEEDEDSSRLISAGELLIIEFGMDQKLSAVTCKKFFTGP